MQHLPVGCTAAAAYGAPLWYMMNSPAHLPSRSLQSVRLLPYCDATGGKEDNEGRKGRPVSFVIALLIIPSTTPA
jgi:hypothetical protein